MPRGKTTTYLIKAKFRCEKEGASLGKEIKRRRNRKRKRGGQLGFPTTSAGRNNEPGKEGNKESSRKVVRIH